uniref:Replication factor C subunit 3 n=1 Tax=Reticulitermes speratus TaxID=60591 RepID=A0A2Z5U5W7_9NEOP
MSLWVDKYRPNSLTKLDYHKTQALHLKNLVQQGDFPHLLVYGPSGAGKKTRIFCLLRELYGPGVERLRLEHMNIQTPSNKKIDITTVSSNYHLEVNPSDVGFHDRVVIQELIKTVAQTHQLDPSGQREFKVVVICEADCLTKDAQHALRRTMEKYVATCRIILVAHTISRVIPAIRSRCLGVRVGAPTKEEIISILQSLCRKEGLSLPNELAERIAVQSNGNLRRAILFLETCKVQQYPFQPDQKVAAHDWEIFLKDTAKMIVQEQSPQKLLQIRNRLYELMIHGIPSEFIFKGLLQELVKNCDMQLKTQVVEKAAFFEHRIHLGSKPIIHLEAFVASFMASYKKFMEATVADLF